MIESGLPVEISLENDATEDLTANLNALQEQLDLRVPVEELVPQLEELLNRISPDDPLRARALRLMGIAKNRLGIPQDAIADLIQARSIALRQRDLNELADISFVFSTVYAWRGDGRASAWELLNAIVLGELTGKSSLIALSLAEAGRLAIEVGRSPVAVIIFRALSESGINALSTWEGMRARVGYCQALNRTGCHVEALEMAERFIMDIPMGAHRLRLLMLLETARARLGLGEIETAHAVLVQARQLLIPEEHVFEKTEYLEVKAELQFAMRDPATTKSFQQVIDRCDEDKLVARGLNSRLRLAEALVLEGRVREAQAVRAVALASAVEHGYFDIADLSRSALIRDCTGDEILQVAARDTRADKLAVARRYVLITRIGAGAFSTVYRALDLEDGSEVALKKIDLSKVYEVGRREQLIASIENEYRAAAKVIHPGLVRVRDVLVERDGTVFIVQDFIDGPTFETALAAGLPPGDLLEALGDVADAISALHRNGIVHRDLKPGNIIIRHHSTPVVVDLGIAKYSDIPDLLASFGTAGYAAPEQAHGCESDHRVDIYSIGKMINQVCGDRICWRSLLFAAIRGKAPGGVVPLRLRRLAQQMIDSNPDRRPADLTAVAATLRAHAAHLKLSATESGKRQR